MLELYFVYNGHCKFYLGTFDNVDDLIEQMEDHQWAFSAITHPRFQKHIGQLHVPRLNICGYFSAI